MKSLIVFLFAFFAVSGLNAQESIIEFTAQIEKFDAIFLTDGIDNAREPDLIPMYGTITFGTEQIEIAYNKRKRANRFKVLELEIKDYEILEEGETSKVKYAFENHGEPKLSSNGLLEFDNGKGTFFLSFWSEEMRYVYAGKKTGI